MQAPQMVHASRKGTSLSLASPTAGNSRVWTFLVIFLYLFPSHAESKFKLPVQGPHEGPQEHSLRDSAWLIKDKDGQGHSKRWLQQLIEDAAVEHFFVLASRQHHGWHGHIPRAHLCATSQICLRYLREVLKHAPAQHCATPL